GFTFAGNGTRTAAQNAGDCHVNQCDGAGNIVSAVDDSDKPALSNQCLGAACTNGVPSTPPVNMGTACNQNGGVACDGAGSCVQCFAASDCPGQDTDC